MAITGDGGEVLHQGKPAEAKAIPNTNLSKGNNMQQNDGQENAGAPRTTFPSAQAAADAMGVGGGVPGPKDPGYPGGAPFARPVAAFARPVLGRGGMIDPMPQMGAGPYIRNQMGFGDQYGSAPFSVIDMEEHIHEVARIEEIFATYLTEFPPAYMADDDREEHIRKGIRHALVMVRNLRELVIAQLTEHLGSRQNGHDPFFSQHRIPRLIPIPAHEAEGKPWEAIPFPEYFQRLSFCFPNFSAPVFMHMIAAFGPMLNVGTSTVEGAPREHFLILPDAQEVVKYVSDMIAKQPPMPNRQY